jgi:hypothetical protein
MLEQINKIVKLYKSSNIFYLYPHQLTFQEKSCFNIKNIDYADIKRETS